MSRRDPPVSDQDSRGDASASRDSGERAAAGALARDVGEERSTLAEKFSACRERLERMVAFRLDPRIRGRLDPADILQEAYLVIARRFDDYLRSPDVSFYVWVRQQTYQVMIDQQRRQFRDGRNPAREISRVEGDRSQATSVSIARRLLSPTATPSQLVARAEETHKILAALDSMNEFDREVLALRHFEQLTNREVAETLGIGVTAASNRYIRAAARLGTLVRDLSASKRGNAGMNHDG